MENQSPQPGDIIYIDSRCYIDSPFRDVVGGKARIESVTNNGKDFWITIEGSPTSSYNWTYLSEMQEDLKNTFGDTWSGKPRME